MADTADSITRNVSLAGGGPGRLSVVLVVLTGLATTVALGSVAAYWWYGEIQRRLETLHPAVLELSVVSLEQRFDRAREAIAQAARASRTAPSNAAREALAHELLSSSTMFSGALFLDGQGQLRASAGGEGHFNSLVQVLNTGGAVNAGLADAMAAVQLRRELASVEGVSIRLFDVERRPCVVVSASVAGRGVSLHAVVREAELSAALRTDLLGVGGIQLVASDGRIVAQSGEKVRGPLSTEALNAPAKPQLNVPWNAEDVWTVRSASPAGVGDLTVVVEQSVLLAFESMVLAAVQMAAISAVVLVAFTLLASVMAVRLTSQLQAVFDGFRAIASGDYSFRVLDSKAGGQLGLIYRAFNAMATRLEEQRAKTEARLNAMSKQNVGFQKQHETLAKLSITDGLTKLHNHRHFQDQLGREIKRLARTQEGLSILIIDIDDFKKLNDSYGHAAGDEFLKQIAGILKESVRDTDILARYGGEEFVIVAVGTAIEGAYLLGEKLRTRVAETSFIVDDTKRPRGVTVSIGVAEFVHSRTELFSAADAALYRAKAAGKNCVVVAERRAEEGAPE